MTRLADCDGCKYGGIHVAGCPKPRYYVWWGTVNLGWVDSIDHAEGIIRQHLARRRRGQHERAYHNEYRIEERASC